MADPAASPLRVLLVDDDEDEHIIVGDLLRSAHWANFDLAWASNYDDGLKSILSSRFDVCLVDYRLGERSGLDLLSEVTAKLNYTEIILLTGEGDREIDETATKIGAADYLVKSALTPALLERALRYAMERGRMSNSLREARAMAESATRAKSDFLATMSHEIRTPMNAILGMSDMLRESKLDAAQMRNVDVIRRAGSNLLVLINDILDLSKIEAGKIELEEIEFDLNDVVDQAIELTGVKTRSKGIALLSDLSPSVPLWLVGDPARLRQILINLLGNAAKFTDSGKIVLTVRNCESGQPGEIAFTVSDTGIGILPDKLESVFDSFSQAESSTASRYGGTGLGLNISKRLVEQMGGCLTVASRVGEGSTFRFHAQFRVAAPSARKTPSHPNDFIDRRAVPKTQSLRPLRILVAEDSPDNSLLIQVYLAGSVHSLTFVEDGQAAVNRFSAEEFDLILMDQRMPVMDGLAATRAIRAIERDRGSTCLPVIALTANASAEDVATSREAGCTYHLSKPFSRHQLLGVMEESIHHSSPVEGQFV